MTPAFTPTEGETMEGAKNADIEATAAVAAATTSQHRPKHGDKSLAINRTISFRDGLHSKPSRGMRKRSARTRVEISDGEERSIASDTDEGDYSVAGDDDDDDDVVNEEHQDELLDEIDNDDDDALSMYSTDASFISEDEPDDEHRKRSRMSRLTPAIIARRREKRRRRRQREEREKDVNKNTKVYRRMPVLTGVIAPFSIMLEIPGFTSRWYVRRDPLSGSLMYRANPIILDVGLAISLASAIVANISILGRFAERIAPTKSTIVAGTCLILHDIINAVALITFGVVHAVNDGFTYSEAYWMTTAATAASLICTASLIIDYVSTTNFRNAGSGLTPKQAQLVMVIMAFLAYISISAMIYALVQPLPFLDSMYFMVETLATVGLGDITPSNLGGRIALFFIAPGGIVLLAVVVAIARQTIIEEFENAYKRRRAIFKQKAAERKEERRKNRHMRIKIKRGSGRGGTAALPPNAALSLLETPTMSSMSTSTMSHFTPYSATTPARRLSIPTAKIADGGRWFGGSLAMGFSRRAANASRQDPNQLPYSTDQELFDSEKGPIAPDYLLNGGRSLQRTDTGATTSVQLREFESMLVNQRQGIEQGFKQFRLDLAKAERNEFWTKLGVAASLFACFWLVGGAVFSSIEGWSYFEGFYFVFVVFTSIGYGDFSPKTSAGRAFFIVWALFGVGTLTILFSVVSDAWANRVQQRKLAGEKVKKKSMWSKMANKVKGNKGRARSALKKEKRDAEAKEREEEEEKEKEERRRREGNVSPDGSTEKDSQETAVSSSNGGLGEAKGGGILRDPNSKDIYGAPAKQHNVKEEALDLSQLHMDFTTKAMEFHQSALAFMQNNRSNVVEAFGHVPEMRDTLERVHMRENGTAQHKLSDVDRYMLLERVKESGDEKAIQSTHQWLLLQDFEQMVHSLVEKSGYFESEINKREGLLQQARDQVDDLKAKLHRQSLHDHVDEEAETEEKEKEKEKEEKDEKE